MILAFLGGFLVSLYLMLRISYRQVLAAVHSKLPSAQSMKETVSSFRREVQESSPKNDSKLEARKRELEEERERIQKLREAEKLAEKPISHAAVSAGVQHVPIQKKTPSGVLSGLFRSNESPVEADSGVSHNKTPDFGQWQTPPVTLLHEVKHIATVSDAEIAEKSNEIETTLLQFKIGVEMR